MDKAINKGYPYPLGATVTADGVNFSLYSKNGDSVELLLFESSSEKHPSRSIFLNKHTNRSGNYWHVFVKGLKAGALYGYRISGSDAPGNCFDNKKLLLDPYSLSIFIPQEYQRQNAAEAHSDIDSAARSIVVDINSYDWQGDLPLNRPWCNQVIYELHCGGFTRQINSRIHSEKRGTFAGLIEKIPYLYDLGVTTVQLMPISQFDTQDAPAGLTNYWGYSPISLFAPHNGYLSTDCQPSYGPNQFRNLVKAMHQAKIEVIIELITGFTSEGDLFGPTVSYRGIDNSSYYLLKPDGTSYQDCFGRGNTLNIANPIVRKLIIDALHYWVDKMHIDGFRVDLAMLLQRDQDGQPTQSQPLLEDIASDAILAGTKFIFNSEGAFCAEAVLQLFSDRKLLTGTSFSHSMRRFVKSTDGTTAEFAQEMFPANPGSELIRNRLIHITSHNGFTLNDLVSFNQKNNYANQENNSDGTFDNESWNCGHEGPAAPVEVELLRSRQIKNFFTCLLIAPGVPIISMGDEIRRTQQGNNNAYCQDNEISWLDWELLERHKPLRRFVKILIEQRKLFFNYGEGDVGLSELLHTAHITWHGVKLNQPDWSSDSHSIAATVQTSRGGLLWHCMFNSYWQSLEFEVPPLTLFPEHSWRRWVDTSREPPEDICDWQRASLHGSMLYTLPERSTAILIASPPR